MTVDQVDIALLYDSNIFLLKGEKNILIDAGTGFQSDMIIQSLKRMLKGQKIDYLVLTHRHFDHVGGARSIIAEYVPEVIVGRGDAEPLRNGDSKSTMGVTFGGTIDKMNVTDVKDGDLIDIGSHRLRVIETPGHTLGSICLYDEITKSLFTGDLVFVGGIGRFDLPTGSGSDLIQSLRKISSLEVNGFYPGHGPAMESGGREQIINGLLMMGEKP